MKSLDETAFEMFEKPYEELDELQQEQVRTALSRLKQI
jgi:hypothetical protein